MGRCEGAIIRPPSHRAHVGERSHRPPHGRRCATHLNRRRHPNCRAVIDAPTPPASSPRRMGYLRWAGVGGLRVVKQATGCHLTTAHLGTTPAGPDGRHGPPVHRTSERSQPPCALAILSLVSTDPRQPDVDLLRCLISRSTDVVGRAALSRHARSRRCCRRVTVQPKSSSVLSMIIHRRQGLPVTLCRHRVPAL
jgi:hypothetical protein